MKIPEKTVERLSLYRRILYTNKESGKEFIYSHEIAGQLNLTPVQVRRDIMLIGYSGSQRKGYSINDLIEIISKLLDPEKTANTIVVGMGNLGKAITSYFKTQKSKIDILACFDSDSNKVNRIISGIESFHIDNIEEVVKSKNIDIAILTLPPEYAQDVCDRLVYAGIKGILNFTSVSLNVPNNIYIESYDMITSLEKIAFFTKSK